jgi:hypothetical protein
MNNAYVWGYALPFAVFIISAGLFIFAAWKKWQVVPDRIEPPGSPVKDNSLLQQGPLKERITFLITQYRWELILAGTFGAILLFALIFAPPRLTGAIAIEPSSPGRPFYNLRWIRAFLRNQYDELWIWTGASISILCLVLLMWAFLKRSGFGAQFVLLCASMNLAIVGQWMLHDKAFLLSGKILYYFAIFGFGLWAWSARRRLGQDLEEKPFSRVAEVILILGLLLLTSFNRLYALRAVPYGIEGDEAKWTSEAVNLGMRGVPDSSGEYHRDALPVSYYLQIPLHRLLGPSLYAARLTVVFLSIIGTLLFYWLLRQISNIPLAALSTYFLSISIFDISASRLANVESFVKIWPILALALLALAVRMRRWQVYGLSGLAIALGMLTYDTVWPVFGVAVLIGIIELLRQRENRQAGMASLGALIAPTLLALPVIVPYLASRLPYYELDEKGLDTEIASKLAEYFGNVIYTWFITLKTDFLYNRPGPLLNALLLPWLVLGLVIACSLVKKKVSYWTLLWVGLVIFPVPILANSPMGRVYYPALPAVYALVALGIFFFWKEIDRFFGRTFRPMSLAISLVPLVWLPFANLFIYFNEVSDAEDRLMRREIGEFAAQAAGDDALILLPATPGLDTPLNNEYQMLELYMLQKVASTELSTAYRYVPPEELFFRIRSEAPNHRKIEVIFDKLVTQFLADSLKLCYPQGMLTEGKYFSRFSLNSSAAEQKGCSFTKLSVELVNGNNLDWELSDGTTQKLELDCEVRQKDFEWLEAENMFMDYGWQEEIEFAPGWSGTGFAMDYYHSGPLLIDAFIEHPGNHYIWTRYYQRALDENAVYLNIDSRTYPFVGAKDFDLYDWKWERIGPVSLGTDSELSISRIYKGAPEKFMAFFIDSLVITSDAEFSPDTDLWKPASPKTFMLEQPQSSGTIRLDLPPDSYRCKAIVESEIPVVDSLGNLSPSVISNSIEFDLR